MCQHTIEVVVRNRTACDDAPEKLLESAPCWVPKTFCPEVCDALRWYQRHLLLGLGGHRTGGAYQ